MAGISSRAAGILENSDQTFQEQKFDDDFGLSWISFKWRIHDPQTGRFLQIDPMSEEYRYQSTYNFSENRLTDGRELEGLEYVTIHHYADGTSTAEKFYKMSDKEINRRNGTTSGQYNAASFGPLGKGVLHLYYNKDGSVDASQTRWDNARRDFNMLIGQHGLYSGPGCITNRYGNDDFSYQPIDWANAIAKRYDMDYAKATATGEPYSNYVEDTRTLQADKDMIARVNNILDDINTPFKKNSVDGVETPFRTSSSGEMRVALAGQVTVITALATYKQWKIDNNKQSSTYDDVGADFQKYDPIQAAIIELIRPKKKNK